MERALPATVPCGCLSIMIEWGGPDTSKRSERTTPKPVERDSNWRAKPLPVELTLMSANVASPKSVMMVVVPCERGSGGRRSQESCLIEKSCRDVHTLLST